MYTVLSYTVKKACEFGNNWECRKLGDLHCGEVYTEGVHAFVEAVFYGEAG